MAKQKDITYNQLSTIKPVTDSQTTVFESYKKGLNQFLYGCAGTGKTFISLYLALQDVAVKLGHVVHGLDLDQTWLGSHPQHTYL